jgi:hypothetical protein
LLVVVVVVVVVDGVTDRGDISADTVEGGSFEESVEQPSRRRI